MELQRNYEEGGRLKKWPVRNFSIYAFYKNIALYGEGYRRPLILSAFIILAFWVLRVIPTIFLNFEYDGINNTPLKTYLDILLDSIAAYIQVPRGANGQT